jgi:hypothetical protein
VKKEVGKINQKGDLTPAELESLYKASCFAEKMRELCPELEPENMTYGMYGMYPYMHDMGYSERPNRSPVTGRYISRGMDRMDGMSGHSIEDRMIATLEDQMDKAKSEYERELVRKEIEHIRSGSR